jgi:hypothetical protein
MKSSDLQDIKELAEQVEKEEPMRPVAFTMSVLAVLLAVNTVMGERTHANAVLMQDQATDQWNDYQAHKIRSTNTQLVADLLSVVAIDNKPASAKLAKAYADQIKKSTGEQTQLQSEGNALQAKVTQGEARSDRYDLGQVLLEIGLVITSVTLLTRSKIYWYLGIVSAIVGMVVSASALFLK